jgi:predicted YcjX-like family ATPase
MGLRGVKVKGGKTRDIPLPAAVMTFLQAYVQRALARVETVGPAAVLVNLGSARRRQDARADDGQEHLAALQGVRSHHRLPRAEAA